MTYPMREVTRVAKLAREIGLIAVSVSEDRGSYFQERIYEVTLSRAGGRGGIAEFGTVIVSNRRGHRTHGDWADAPVLAEIVTPRENALDALPSLAAWGRLSADNVDALRECWTRRATGGRRAYISRGERIARDILADAIADPAMADARVIALAYRTQGMTRDVLLAAMADVLIDEHGINDVLVVGYAHDLYGEIIERCIVRLADLIKNDTPGLNATTDTDELESVVHDALRARHPVLRLKQALVLQAIDPKRYGGYGYRRNLDALVNAFRPQARVHIAALAAQALPGGTTPALWGLTSMLQAERWGHIDDLTLTDATQPYRCGSEILTELAAIATDTVVSLPVPQAAGDP